MNRWVLLAARNLLRHRRRTFLTGSIVVVGFVAVTMTAGFVSQTFSALKSATIRGGGGHLRILDARAAGKTDDEAATILLDDWPGLSDALARDPRVAQAMPKLSFFGLAVKGDKSAAYLGTGTIPALEKKASLAAETVQSGAFFENAEANEIMLGTGLARAIDAKAGDLVTVMTTTPEGGINAVDATVAAVLAYPIKELDDRILYMPFAAAARLLKAEGKANSVVVLLKDDRDTELEAVEIPKALAARGRPVALKTWLDTATFYKQVKLLYISIFFFMGLVLSVVVILATANTMTMSVFERTREIGTLLAIGMERGSIRTLFLARGHPARVDRIGGRRRALGAAEGRAERVRDHAAAASRRDARQRPARRLHPARLRHRLRGHVDHAPRGGLVARAPRGAPEPGRGARACLGSLSSF